MGKKKKKKKVIINKQKLKTLDEIQETRTGGQNALIGYDYQVLYSCYILLTFLDDQDKMITLEGIEDVDTYSVDLNNKENIEHIQLKQSVNKQDASFLKDILKNFIEVYLNDNNRKFKLVYDFTVADGNLKKIFNNNLDQKTYAYWQEIITRFKQENPNWNWIDFNFQVFLSHLFFENFKKNELAFKVEKLLIDNFDINTGNEKLFVNGLYVLCFNKMKNRENITLELLLRAIQDIKDNIAKGFQNPAYQWISRIDFDNITSSVFQNTFEYYDGKKAEPIDIINELPVRRLIIENEIISSIKNNVITVIKSSSGQGKTTLALQTAFNLKNEYTIYKLTWCEDNKEISNMVEYFKSRIKVGEKPLIILDNLDVQLKEWDKLAQIMSEQLRVNYKILITTREDDWKLYSGSQANLKSLNIVDIELTINEAEKIYDNLKKYNKLHKDTQYWQTCWEMVSERKLLIEYIYLLTHGQMLADRIDEQIKELQNDEGRIKCDVLRQVCLADTIGVKLPVKKLIENLGQDLDKDISLIIENLEKEFYITIKEENIYVEGLHPVRSEHIVKRLHKYIDINNTLNQLLEIVDEKYVSKLYSVLPQYIKADKENFYRKLISESKDKNNDFFLNALNGLFSGSVNSYYYSNKTFFDDANAHFALSLFIMELNPFAEFREVNDEIRPLTSIYKMTPENENISYMYNLSKEVKQIELDKSDIYIYGKCLYDHLKQKFTFTDKDVSVKLACWLINFNPTFNLLLNLSFDEIWNNSHQWGISNISELMYCWFLTDKTACLNFINKNKSTIINFLKEETFSMQIYEKDKNIHVEYLLTPEQINIANDLSVNRIQTICKTMPIYETYCSDGIKPQIEILQGFNYPDDSHKTMPFRNIVIGFHHNFANLWDETISSNYECSSVYEWLLYWQAIRQNICTFIEHFITILEKSLNGKQITENFGQKFIDLCDKIKFEINCEYFFPGEKIPFIEKDCIPEEIKSFKNKYFAPILNFIDNCLKIIGRIEQQNINLATNSIKTAQAECEIMQEKYKNIVERYKNTKINIDKLSHTEFVLLERLECYIQFYLEHTKQGNYSRSYIEKWYEQKQYLLINSIKTSVLENNIYNLSYTFPNKIIKDGILNTFPLIIHGLNLLSVEDQNKILNTIKSIVEHIERANVHFITIILENNGKVFNLASRLSLDNFEEYLSGKKVAIPMELNDIILNCFSEKFNVIKFSNNRNLGLDSLFIKLWEYAQYQKYLNNKFNKLYLEKIQDIKKDEIDKYWIEIKNSIQPNLVETVENIIVEICEKNHLFNDNELNQILGQIIEYHINQIAH